MSNFTLKLLAASCLALVLACGALGSALAQDEPTEAQKKEAMEKQLQDKGRAARIMKRYFMQQEPYMIGPSDLLEIIVWREGGVTRPEVLVRPDGRISLPLVDDVQAAGLTTVELKQELTNALRDVMESPMVYVIVKDPRSKNFSILGNVNQPGRYPLLMKTTVLQALSMASGFSEWADKDDVTILRQVGEEQRLIKFDYSKVIEGKDMSQNIFLETGDVIIVP